MFKINMLIACAVVTGALFCTPVQAAILSQSWGITADDGRAADL